MGYPTSPQGVKLIFSEPFPFQNGALVTQAEQLHPSDSKLTRTQARISIDWQASYFAGYSIDDGSAASIHPIRMAGPMWSQSDDFFSCAFDCAMVAAKLLGIGRTAGDVSDFLSSKLPSTLTTLFLGCASRNFACIPTMQEQKQIQSLFKQTHWQYRLQEGKDANFSPLWTHLLPMTSQFQLSRRIMSHCTRNIIGHPRGRRKKRHTKSTCLPRGHIQPRMIAMSSNKSTYINIS